MKFHACQRQKFVFDFGISNASIKVRDSLPRQKFFKFAVKFLADTVPAKIFVEINRQLRRNSVSFAPDETFCMSVSDNLPVAFGNQIREIFQDIDDSISEFVDGRHGAFKTNRGVGDVRRINFQQFGRVVDGCRTNFDFHQRRLRRKALGLSKSSLKINPFTIAEGVNSKSSSGD